jgi:multiple sugar transport system substrate-binding protein
MQASYIMVANRKALPYLPKGASLGSLTYEELLEWGKNLYDRTGKARLGFPAGAKGLMHRFFQGYLYPSFTGSTLLKFRTSEAVAMWSFFRGLWHYVNPASITYSTMADPLLTEDVLVAWDHTARLLKALEQRPEDFVAFPAPRGPRGRGFMPVVSGLAIPAGSATADSQAVLIDFLTQPEIQNRMLRETGFFPVLGGMTMDSLPPYLLEMKKAVAAQAEAPDSIPVLMPIGLGDRGDDFNSLYMLSFSRIVLEGGDVAQTLDANAALLQGIIDERNLRCWLPDVSDERPCRIE